MNDIDIKTVFNRIVDQPGPPLTDRETTLDSARRSLRRRRLRWAAGAAVSVTAAVAAGAFAVASVTESGGGQGPVAASGHTAADTSVPASPQAPPTQEPPPHVVASGESLAALFDGDVSGCSPEECEYASRMLSATMAAVPTGDGFTTPKEITVQDGRVLSVQGITKIQLEWGGEEIGGIAMVYQDDQVVSTLTVGAVRIGRTPTGDLCQEELEPGTAYRDTRCRVVTGADGKRVRLGGLDLGGDSAALSYATYYADGWRITVSEDQFGIPMGSGGCWQDFPEASNHGEYVCFDGGDGTRALSDEKMVELVTSTAFQP